MVFILYQNMDVTKHIINEFVVEVIELVNKHLPIEKAR